MWGYFRFSLFSFLEQHQSNVASEDNALSIGYGSMLLKGFLAIIVIIACGTRIGLGIEKNGPSIGEDLMHLIIIIIRGIR